MTLDNFRLSRNGFSAFIVLILMSCVSCAENNAKEDNIPPYQTKLYDQVIPPIIKGATELYCGFTVSVSGALESAITYKERLPRYGALGVYHENRLMEQVSEFDGGDNIQIRIPVPSESGDGVIKLYYRQMKDIEEKEWRIVILQNGTFDLSTSKPVEAEKVRKILADIGWLDLYKIRYGSPYNPPDKSRPKVNYDNGNEETVK